MTTSKLVKSLTPDFQKDFIGVNADVMTALIAKAITAYRTQELLQIQETTNSGGTRPFYLMKRPSKKAGYIYQVRYRDPETNRILPTKYSTGTNDFEKAVRWAEQNKEKCLTSYSGKAELTTLETYYSEGSKYLQYEGMDGRKLSDVVRKQRHGFMINHLIPFFQSKKVRYLSQITPIHIKELKHHLSKEKHLTPQTINAYLHSFKKCLELMRDMGKIKTDFSKCSFTQKGSKQAEKTRGIYGIDTLKGVFNKVWNNELSRVLCMVIYFTGIRNNEIQRMRFNDIEKINDVYFLNVRGTKSKNAKRKVPIHHALYWTLENYVRENGIDNEMPMFSKAYNDTFRKASFDMGFIMNHSENELLEKGICFYSGRHTFKSIMTIGNADKTAEIPIEIQEVFMGHHGIKEELKKQGIKEYAYTHLESEAFITKYGKEVLKTIDRFYL